MKIDLQNPQLYNRDAEKKMPICHFIQFINLNKEYIPTFIIPI